MKTMDLIQELYFVATPEQVYDSIMIQKLHAEITNSDVAIENEINTAFSAYNNYILGNNVLLDKPTLIVQEWRAVEENWPDYHLSTVQFKIQPSEEGAHLTFIHKGIPEEYFESISTGWDEYYWKPMKAFYKSHPS